MGQNIPLFQTFLRTWNGWSLRRRFGMLLAPLVLFGAVNALVYGMVPRQTMLFATSLDSEQLSQVDAQLAAWNVAHMTTTDNVRVDAGSRNTVLLRLSLAGLPHAHIATSDETLAKASALTPDALLEIQSRTGLAGDIAVALRSIEGVADASVVIAPARQGTFTDDSSSLASASVRLSLRPGVALSKEAVDGIAAFVSNAVPFLDRSHVVLLDDHGVALGGTTAKQDDVEATRLALQSAFDSAFGVGVTIVRVHAVYEQQTEHFHEVDHLPVSGGALALQKSDENFQSHEKRYTKHDSTENHGSIERDRETVAAAGMLNHFSVAVLVDDASNLDLEKIRSVALAAIGADGTQSGLIHVEAVHFHHPETFRLPAVWPWLSIVAFVLPYMAIAGICIGGIWLLRDPIQLLARNMLERTKVRTAMEATQGIAPRDVVGLLAGEPPYTAAAVISALPTVTAAAVLDLYPNDERGAIVARMARQSSVFAPTWEQLARVR